MKGKREGTCDEMPEVSAANPAGFVFKMPPTSRVTMESWQQMHLVVTTRELQSAVNAAGD